MTLKQMALDYRQSAGLLKGRIDLLKQEKQQANEKYRQELDGRLTILTAEYYYLLRTAKYLRDYYQACGEGMLYTADQL